MPDRRIQAFERPPHATHHCRHYSYVPGLGRDSGPKCAVEQDLGHRPIGSTVAQCMPEPTVPCWLREEYTDAEREAWKLAREAGVDRLGEAVQALPRPIPLRTSGTIECPNCGGTITYARWHRGAEIACDTPGCCAARFNIAAGADWPARKKEEANG